MIRTSHFARLVALFAVGLIGLSASRVAAQTYTNVTGNWTNAALWVGGVAPVPGTTTSLTFGTQANPFDNLGYTATNDNTTVPFVLNSITLTSTAAATNVLNGNALQFAGSAAINQNGYGPFTIANNINVATNTSLAATGIGWVELSGSLSGASSLTRSTGSGATYILSGSNSGYSGTTVLSAGILRVTSANGLGTGSVSIGGATLEVRANNIVSGPVAYGNNITVNGSTGANLTLANNGGTFTTFNFGSLTFVGTGTLNANFTPNSQGNSVSSIGFANAFSSAVFAGPVSLITNVSNGFAVNGNAQTLGGAVSQSFVRLDGAISQTGTSAQITKTGGGTLIITTVGNTYSGITNVNAGTLRVQPATSTAPYASSLGTNAAISQNGGTLDLRLNGAGSNGVIAFTNGTAAYNITHAGAANTQALFVGNNGTGTGNVVQLGSLTISNSGSTYQVNNNNGYGVAFTGAVNFPAAAASVAIAPTGNFYYPAFSAPVDASFVPGVSIQTLATGVAGTNFIKSSQGTLLFAGASNSFAGTFTARNGTTLLGADITATGNSVIGVGASVLVTDTSVATDNITALLTVGSGRVIARPITVQNFSSGAVYLGASDVATSSFTGAVTLNRAANLTAPAGATVTFGGAIGGTGTLYKTEAGTAVLTAANNFTGATGVYGGTLRVGGAAGSLTATPSITVSSGGTLVADNSTSVLGVRLGGGNAALTLGGLPAAAAVPYSIFNSGGTLQVDSTGNGGSGSYSEQFNGILTLGTGASRILANSGSVQSQIVFGTASSGIRRAVGASGTLDISNNGGQVSFINLPLVNGLIGGYATVNGGASWATTTGSAVVPYASFVNSFTLPTDNVDLNGGAFLTGANTVHTIRDNTGFQTVDLNGGSLRITGGILVTANAIGDSAITNGTVYAVATQQGSDLIVHQYNPTSSFSLPNIGFTIQPQPRTGTLNATTTVTFTGSTSDLFIGQGVTGTNIPANTTIAAISGSTVTLSAAASGSGASTLTFASTASGLTKTGPGILDLTGVNVYAGPTTISAGTVRFQPGSASAPASAVSIAGGATLDLNDTTQFVGSLNGSGVTSIGAGTLYLGSDGTSTTYAGQITTGAAGRFVKVGGGTQVLTNIATGTAANNLGSELVIAQGLLEGRTYLSGSNPFGSGAVNVVVAGGTAVLRTDGNNTGAAELVTTFNNLSFATGGVDASGIPYSTNGTIDINRNLTTNIGFNISANKTVQIAGLTIGRGVMTLSTSSNLNGVVVTGTTTLTDGGSNFTFNLNSALNLGVIADSVTGIGNTLNLRVGGSAGGSLFINAPSTAVGGAYLLSGTTNFGSVVLGAQLNSTTANLGTGLVTVAPGAGIRLNGAGNIGSRLDAISNLFTLPNINLATNISPAALNVRSISYDAAPGFVNFSTAIGRTTYTTTGGGTGLINLATMGYTGISDLRLIGGGNWSVGGLSGVDGELGNSNAQGLIPGAGNVYRLAGNGGGLQVDYDILHDMPNGVSTLLVGGPILSGTASLPTSSNTRFLTGQSFTGPTQVGRGSQVEFREPVASSSFELFGTLSLTGNAALTTAQAANVVIRPGGILVADNNINQTQVIDRIPDATNFALNSGGLQYRGANGTTETVANVSFDGGSSLSVNHVTSNATLALGNLTRTNFGTLGIGASGAALGLAAAGDRVTATNAAEFQLGGTQTTTVGTTYIVRPYIVDTQNNSHVTYGGTAVGFTDAAYVALASGQTGGTTIAQTAVAVPLAAPTDILALRITGAVAVSGSGANTLTIRSGGVIATASGASITAPTLYGATGTSEADIYVATSGNFFDFGTLQSVASTVATRSVDGQITAVNLVKFGPGGLRINGPQPTLSGSVIVNQGILELRYTPPDAITGTNAATLNAGVPIVFNGPGTQFNIRTNIANYVFDQPISIGAGVPTVTFDANSAGGTYGTAIFRSLTFGGAGGTTGSLADQQGQIVNQTQNNTIRFNGGTATSGNILNLASGLNVLQAAGTFEFVGPAVGPSDAVLVKNGAGAVTLIASATGSPFNAASSFSAALVNNGTLELRSNATTDLNIGTIGGGASAASPSTLVLNGGTLNLRYTASNPGYNLFSNIVVSANATASLSTSSGNTATPITVTGGLTIGNQTFFINGGNGVNWQFTGATTLTGNAVLVPYGNNFSGNGVTTLNGAVTDGGRDVFLTKNGSTNLRLTAAGSYTGGTIVNNGTLDLAIPTAAGSGNITLNPSGGVFFSNTGAIGIALGNFATTGGQRVIINSSPVSPVFIAIGGNFNPNINGTNGLNVSDNTPTLGNVLAISGTNSQALNLATLGNGRWALGLTPFATNATYSATTLGVGSDGIYRLGAGAVPDNNGTLAAGTLTISAANVLVDPVGGGTSRLQIGLPGYIANGFGIVTLNNAQSLTGGVVVNRGSILNLNDTVAAGNGSLQSQTIDIFGTLTLRNTQGRLAGGSTINVYSGGAGTNAAGRLDVDNNQTGGNRIDRLAGNNVNLYGGQIRLTSASNIVSSETIGTLKFRGGSSFALSRTGTGNASIVVGAGSFGSRRTAAR